MTGPTPRSAVQRLVASAPIGYLLRAIAPQHATVLMYHRFVPGHSPDGATTPAADVREMLAYLRRHRYHLMPLRDLLEAGSSHNRAKDRAGLAGAVAVTVDDGYADFAEVAHPILAEFDCPATVFVSTGPVDGTCWFWWDRVQAAVERSPVTQVRVDCEGIALRGSWDRTAGDLLRQANSFSETLKRVPTATRDVAIEMLLTALDVELPDRLPSEFSMMSWDQIRRCERAGVTIGGHTVTHPILAQCDDVRAAYEISAGLSRLRAECAGPVDVFAYPNGGPRDFGDREVSLLRTHGVAWACTTSRGYITPTTFSDAAGSARYRASRFTDPGTLSGLVRTVSGRA